MLKDKDEQRIITLYFPSIQALTGAQFLPDAKLPRLWGAVVTIVETCAIRRGHPAKIFNNMQEYLYSVCITSILAHLQQLVGRLTWSSKSLLESRSQVSPSSVSTRGLGFVSKTSLKGSTLRQNASFKWSFQIDTFSASMDGMTSGGVIGWKSVLFIVKNSNKLPCKASSGVWVLLIGTGSVYLLGKVLPKSASTGLSESSSHALSSSGYLLR